MVLNACAAFLKSSLLSDTSLSAKRLWLFVVLRWRPQARLPHLWQSHPGSRPADPGQSHSSIHRSNLTLSAPFFALPRAMIACRKTLSNALLAGRLVRNSDHHWRAGGTSANV